MLREMGLTAAKPPEPQNCQERLIDEYRRYLLRERGLAEATLLNYVPFAEQLLSNCFAKSDMNLSELTATDITKFMQDRAHQLSSGRAKLLARSSTSNRRGASGRGIRLVSRQSAKAQRTPKRRQSYYRGYKHCGSVPRFTSSRRLAISARREKSRFKRLGQNG
jgi:hypothetical protein